MKPRVAIVAALEREIAPLVRDWPQRSQSGNGVLVYECDRAVAVCAGMGRKRVTHAMELAAATGRLTSVISVGFAGGLRDGIEAGQVYWPATVIDAGTGERYPGAGGSGTLLTSDRVLGRTEKREAAARWGADLVDMEAAVVAKLAQERGLAFRTLRVISDSIDDTLPDLNRFVDSDGEFRKRAFGMYLTFHPQRIPSVIRLGRDSSRAAEAVAQALRKILESAE